MWLQILLLCILLPNYFDSAGNTVMFYKYTVE